MKKEEQLLPKDWSFLGPKVPLQLPSPVIHLPPNPLFNHHPNIFVKCEYQIHPGFGGNKFRKLFYHVQNTIKENIDSWVTFGGPYSNHIAAVSQIGNILGIETIGIIRGRKEFSSNLTLSKAVQNGMSLLFKNKREFDEYLDVGDTLYDFPDSHMIPMGGTDSAGVKGVIDLGLEIENSGLSPDFVVVPFGSGGTFLGLCQNSSFHSIGIPVTAISEMYLKKIETESGFQIKGSLFPGYHKGKIARLNTDMISFIRLIWEEFGIPLDPIYNSLSFVALKNLINSQQIGLDSKIMIIHTGGLQGWLGIREQNKKMDLEFTSSFDPFMS